MIPTIIIASIIGIIFFAIVIKGIINKKNGKSSCSCGSGCGSCSLKGTCHANTEKNEKQ